MSEQDTTTYESLLADATKQVDDYVTRRKDSNLTLTRNGLEREVTEIADSFVPAHNGTLAAMLVNDISFGNVEFDCDGAGAHTIWGIMRWIIYNKVQEDLAGYVAEHWDEWTAEPEDDEDDEYTGPEPSYNDNIAHSQKDTTLWFGLVNTTQDACTTWDDRYGGATILVVRRGLTYHLLRNGSEWATFNGGHKIQNFNSLKDFLVLNQLAPDARRWTSVLNETVIPELLRYRPVEG